MQYNLQSIWKQIDSNEKRSQQEHRFYKTYIFLMGTKAKGNIQRVTKPANPKNTYHLNIAVCSQ